MTSLCINYARAMWTADDVKIVFNNILGENIVSTVEESNKTDYKSFIVHFSSSNALLDQWVSRINIDGFLIMPIDKKGAERYWKLLECAR